MNEQTRQALRRVIDYLAPEEFRHWDESGRPADHIFYDLQQLEAWWCTSQSVHAD